MENENKYIFLEDVINSKYEDFNNKLKEYGYYAIDGDSKVVKYEHETNKSEIHIFMTTEEEIYVDFFNSNRDVYSCYNKFIGVSWYLGKKDNFKVDDIFEVLNNDEFKKFVLVENNKQTKVNPKNLFNKFCDMLLPTDFSKYCTNNKLDLLYNTEYCFTLKGHGYYYQVYISDDEFWFYVYNEKGVKKISRKFATVYDIDKKIGDFSSYFTDVIVHIINNIFEDSIGKFQDNDFSNIRIHKGSDGWKIKSFEDFLKGNNQEQQTQTQNQIENICKAISDVLIDKNKKYGNSALRPINVFYKGDNQNSILIRLDDKLSRIKNNTEDIRVNDICDTIGYLVLLLVAKGVKIEDIEKLKD